MPIVITPSTNGVAGKLADAEVHFTKGPLAGLKLVGFAIWESQWPDRRTGQHVRVSMPSREYAGQGGERKRFDLLRPVNDQDKTTGSALRDAILDAFYAQDQQVEQATAVARDVARAAQQREPAQRLPTQQLRPSTPRTTPAPAAGPRRVPNARTQWPLQRRAAAAGGGRQEPPPHTDDDYPF